MVTSTYYEPIDKAMNIKARDRESIK